jgi:hypothetical protein
MTGPDFLHQVSPSIIQGLNYIGLNLDVYRLNKYVQFSKVYPSWKLVSSAISLPFVTVRLFSPAAWFGL